MGNPFQDYCPKCGAEKWSSYGDYCDRCGYEKYTEETYFNSSWGVCSRYEDEE